MELFVKIYFPCFFFVSDNKSASELISQTKPLQQRYSTTSTKWYWASQAYWRHSILALFWHLRSFTSKHHKFVHPNIFNHLEQKRILIEMSVLGLFEAASIPEWINHNENVHKGNICSSIFRFQVRKHQTNNLVDCKRTKILFLCREKFLAKCHHHYYPSTKNIYISTVFVVKKILIFLRYNRRKFP